MGPIRMIVGSSSVAHGRALTQQVQGLVFYLQHLTQNKNKAKALPQTTAISS